MATTGCSVTPRQKPDSRSWVLDQLFGPQAIPVVLAEEPDPGEPAGPLQPVEDNSASIAGPWGSSGRRRSWPPASRCRAREVGIERRPGRSCGSTLPGDTPAPGTAWTPVMIRLEIPAQVMLEVESGSSAWYPQPPSLPLGLLPVLPGERPDLGLDRHARLAGRVQAQQGVLGVASCHRPAGPRCKSSSRPCRAGRA